MTSTNTIFTTFGSCLDVDLVYRDESGETEDVSSDTFSIFASEPLSLKTDYVLTKTDPANGVVHLHLDETDALELGKGRVNWIRVARTFTDGCIDNTEKIWIKVK